MKNLVFPFEYNGTDHQFEMVPAMGTIKNDTFVFGCSGEQQYITIADFYIAKFQTSQALWNFVMGEDGSRFLYHGDDRPAEHVSWDLICQPSGFLEIFNQRFKMDGNFRLPTETEWEYAARGGVHWRDGFQFAGTDDMAASGWYEGNAGPFNDLEQITRLKNHAKLTSTHPVGQKKPNQLGLYDMNGNVWEWCEDWFVRDTNLIPKDGSACQISGDAKVLRGGCHHNGAVHCTNTKRYEIGPQFFDGCIGFRLALTLQR